MRLLRKKTNNGRSMIEMLGVLALMAILSLVGVYMLQRSMLVHRTNQLVEDMRLAGMVVLDGLYDDLTTDEMSIKGHFEQQTPYNFAAAMESDTLNTFYVIAKGVPFDVCVEVKNRKPQWAEQIVANDEQDTCIDGENNDMGFFFNDELTALMDSCSTDAECGECGKCNNNKCSYGFKNNSGQCFSCDDNTVIIANVDKLECHRCSNRMWRTNNGGQCISCNDNPKTNWRGNVPYEECMRCPNRRSRVSPGQVGNCWWCNGNIDPVTGLCDTIDCNSNDGAVYGVSEKLCNQCNNRFYDRSAHSCDKCGISGSDVSFEECMKCPAQASSASPNGYGTCSPCSGNVNLETGKCDAIDCNSDITNIGGVSQALCNQCNNRFYSTHFGGRCIKCMTTGDHWVETPFEECLRCPHQASDVSAGQVGTCRYCAGTVNKTTGKCIQ